MSNSSFDIQLSFKNTKYSLKTEHWSENAQESLVEIMKYDSVILLSTPNFAP